MPSFDEIEDKLVPNRSIIKVSSPELTEGRDAGVYKGHNTTFVWYRSGVSYKKLERALIRDIDVSDITAP